MIHVFYVPGMFGATIEYVLRDFTNELEPTNALLGSDGSMHSFKRQNLPKNKSMLDNIKMGEISTPPYPFGDLHLPEMLELYPINVDDRCILIYAESFQSAEQNILFQYHKISIGEANTGLEIFYGNRSNAKSDVGQWNQDYTRYSDLTPWEFREWFSLFYPSWIQEWQQSYDQVPDNWLKISSHSVLHDTTNTFEKIIDFCNLTKKNGLDNFASQWQNAQQYVLDEYKLINTIVDQTIKKQDYNWKLLHPVAEAMIQNKLRTHGFEIRCNNLNVFPTNSIDLYNLLDNQLQLHQQEIQL